VPTQFQCPDPSEHPQGMYLDFSGSTEVVNNLGGYPGGEDLGPRGAGVDCISGAANLPLQSDCPCGCGCRCTNGGEVAPLNTPEELRYGNVGRIYDGTGKDPVVVDLVVTNITKYTPWSARSNGFHEGGTFAQISLFQDTTTTFRYAFKHTNTDTDATLEHPFEFCLFDLDTGPHYNNQPTMQETLLACGMESYFTHGPTTSAKRSNVRKHMCANIGTREYMDIVYVDGCVRATGLKEGRGSDNPQEFTR